MGGWTMLIRSLIILLMAAIGTSACEKAPYLVGQLQSFSDLPVNWQSKTVGIAPYQGQDAKRLEWRSYAKLLEAKFRERGLRTVSGESQKPDYIAFLGYGIDNGSTVTQSYSIPQWGVTGYSGGYTSGYVDAFGNYSGTTTLTPVYGVTGYSTGTTSSKVYTRSLSIDIRDRESGNNVWEGKVVSSGSCGALREVIDEMLLIAFEKWPLSGSGRYETPSTANC